MQLYRVIIFISRSITLLPITSSLNRPIKLKLSLYPYWKFIRKCQFSKTFAIITFLSIRYGQEAVEEIGNRTLEIFSILKSLQPPVGQYNHHSIQSDRGIQDKQNRKVYYSICSIVLGRIDVIIGDFPNPYSWFQFIIVYFSMATAIIRLW